MDPVEALRERLEKAQHVFVVSGAGISAASGIPTFRGKNGLWKGFRAEELASLSGFQASPERVWEWYRWRRGICRRAEPNPGHTALVALEKRVRSFLLATQNVDGLHRLAGSKSLIELHGCIDEVACTSCAAVGPLREDSENPPSELPRCEQCGALARPRILWFGETYWPGVIERAAESAERADLCLVIGTSGMVWPPMALALASQRAGAHLVEINPEETELSAQADFCFRAGAEQILPILLED
ncbi:MAG: NAD-dependent deacylase [Myxococcota bacterium]|nr:NAD-dependent deacylase [Myxococcota bacterium]